MKVMKEKASRNGSQSSTKVQPAGELDTRERLIHVAIRLFAERGIDGVSTRDITTTANANSAAIGYHFGSKENLVRAVFQSLAGPMNRARLDVLSAYEQTAGPNAPLEIEEVARCLIEPALRAAGNPKLDAHYVGRLLLLARTLPAAWITQVLAEQYDEIFHRFVSAFQRALPNESYETVCWRYDFLVGSLLHAVSYFDGRSRIGRVTQGRCDPNDVDNVIEQLVQFAGGAMRQDGLQSAPAKKRNARVARP
jgi:AcrR family transcriptional regulator